MSLPFRKIIGAILVALGLLIWVDIKFPLDSVVAWLLSVSGIALIQGNISRYKHWVVIMLDADICPVERKGCIIAATLTIAAFLAVYVVRYTFPFLSLVIGLSAAGFTGIKLYKYLCCIDLALKAKGILPPRST